MCLGPVKAGGDKSRKWLHALNVQPRSQVCLEEMDNFDMLGKSVMELDSIYFIYLIATMRSTFPSPYLIFTPSFHRQTLLTLKVILLRLHSIFYSHHYHQQ